MRTFHHKKIALLFVTGTLGLLGGCQSTMESYVYNEGVSVSRADNDYFECEVMAARGVPQDKQIGTTPTYTTPVQTNCYNTGYTVQCYSTGGQTYGGNTYTFDANSELRAKYFAKCMIARGYRVVDLPKCDRDKISDNLMSKLSGKQRKPTEDACYVPITDTTGNVVYPSELSSS